VLLMETIPFSPKTDDSQASLVAPQRTLSGIRAQSGIRAGIVTVSAKRD